MCASKFRCCWAIWQRALKLKMASNTSDEAPLISSSFGYGFENSESLHCECRNRNWVLQPYHDRNEPGIICWLRNLSCRIAVAIIKYERLMSPSVKHAEYVFASRNPISREIQRSLLFSSFLLCVAWLPSGFVQPWWRNAWNPAIWEWTTEPLSNAPLPQPLMLSQLQAESLSPLPSPYVEQISRAWETTRGHVLRSNWGFLEQQLRWRSDCCGTTYRWWQLTLHRARFSSLGLRFVSILCWDRLKGVSRNKGFGQS